MKLSILTPERRLVEGVSIKELSLTTAEGQIQILPGHADIVGILCTGLFDYQREDGQVQKGVISSGFFEVHHGNAVVLAETLELTTEIDLDRAKKAQSKAESMLNNAALDDAAFKKYQLKLERALIRQHANSRM